MLFKKTSKDFFLKTPFIVWMLLAASISFAAPVASDATIELDENSSANFSVTVTSCGIRCRARVFTNTAHGTLTQTGDLSFTYTPETDFVGEDTMTYGVGNPRQRSNIATITFQVNAVNEAPVANDQSIITFRNTAVALTLTATDPEGSPLTYEVAEPGNGSLSGTAPNLTYTPDNYYSGADSFTFTASDGILTSNTATVSITVDATNDAPTANAQSVQTNEDTAINFTLTASDPENQPLTYTVATQPRGALSCTENNCTYTPNADFSGSDNFYFKVSDGNRTSSAAEVTITIVEVNDLPTANAGSATAYEDLVQIIPLSASDPEKASLSYFLSTPAAHGTVTVSGSAATYTPDKDYSGSDQFGFKVNDGLADSAEATITLDVSEINDRPSANNAAVITDEDKAVNFTLASDVDGDVLTVTTYLQPFHGTLTLDHEKATYTPNADFNGEDTFNFTVSDGSYNSILATINITITPVNDVPVASKPWVQAASGKPASFAFSATDIDGDDVSFEITNDPVHGSAILWNEKYGVYRPEPGYEGKDSFSFRAFDGVEYSEIQTVSVDVLLGVAEFPVEVLSIDPAVTKSSTSESIILTLPKSPVEGCSKTTATPPVFPTGLGTASLVATHFPTLDCGGGDGFEDEYAALYIIAPNGRSGLLANYDAYLLDQGYNDEASATYLENGTLLVPVTTMPDSSGGFVVFTGKESDGKPYIEQLNVNPFSTAIDSSLFYDEDNGVVYTMSTNVYESCYLYGNTNMKCGAIAAVHAVTGETLSLIGSDETHHAWGSGAMIKLQDKLFAGFAAAYDETGEVSAGAHACEIGALQPLEIPAPDFSDISTDLPFLATYDPGDPGCTPVGGSSSQQNESAPDTLESAFINGGLVPVDEDSFVAVALGSDTADAESHIYQLDTNLNVEATYTINADYSHSLTNGFYNSFIVDGDDYGYLSVTLEEGPGMFYAILKFDLINHTLETLASELVTSDSTPYSTLHLYFDENSNPVLTYVKDGALEIISVEDGTLVASHATGSNETYIAAPVLIGDGEGEDDALLVVSRDNVVTVIPNTGLRQYADAIWPGPRGGGLNLGR